jgi:hypothetical protein
VVAVTGTVGVDDSVNLVVLLWARPNADDELTAYEDRVLALLDSHDGHLVQRLRSDGADGAPLEIQVIRFANEASYEQYLGDERRVGLGRDRDRAVARTDVHRVHVIANTSHLR